MIISHFISSVILDPLQHLRSVIVYVLGALDDYEDAVMSLVESPTKKRQPMVFAFADLATSLASANDKVPGYQVARWLYGLPSQHHLHKAITSLNLASKTMKAETPEAILMMHVQIANIRKFLKLGTPAHRVIEYLAGKVCNHGLYS